MIEPFSKPAKPTYSPFVWPALKTSDGGSIKLVPSPATLDNAVSALRRLGIVRHARGDEAAKQMVKAARERDRRTMRKWQNSNMKNRAAGTAVEATISLFALMANSMEKRHVPQAAGLNVLCRTLIDGLDLADDLAFEAEIADGYKPQPRERA